MPNIAYNTERRVTLACTCNGCRGWAPELYRYMNDTRVLEFVRAGESKYFNPDSMRFFRSRLLGARDVTNSGGDIVGLIVRESRGAGWELSDGRKHSLSVWCRFASLVATIDGLDDTGAPTVAMEPAQPFTARTCAKWQTFGVMNDYARTLIAACECHGCQTWGTQA